MVVFSISQSLDGISVIWIKSGRYSFFQSPNGDGKIRFLIENTTGTVFLQKLVYGITVIFAKFNDNTLIQNLIHLSFNSIDIWFYIIQPFISFYLISMTAHGCFKLSIYVYLRLSHIWMQQTQLNSRYTESSPYPLMVIRNTYQESSTTVCGGKDGVIKTMRGGYEK